MNRPEPQSPEGVISGSFKFKPEIDAAITEFRDLNVIIRAPEIGWLYAPATGLVIVSNEERFQPLPNERHLMAGDVEAEFLDQLDKSDFVYIMNPEGYIGDMSIFEIGYAHGIRKRMYASNPLDFNTLGIRDPKMINLLHTSVSVMSPAVAARDMYTRMATRKGYPLVTNSSEAKGVRSERDNRQASSLSTALGYVAEGALMRHGDRLLLVEDGRWEHNRLTIPGTRVRTGERRVTALNRLAEEKMGVKIASIAHFVTSFMLPESGYSTPVDSDTFVFDDHIVELRSEQVKPRRGIVPIWVSNAEAEALINSGQVEPNAAKLIASYLRTAA